MASILPSTFNNLILVLVSICGLVHLILVHGLSQAQLIGFCVTILILGLVIGLAILALRHRDQATACVIWIATRLARLRRRPFGPAVSQESTQ